MGWQPISLEIEFMAIIGLQAARTASDLSIADTVADSAPLSLVQLVTPIRDW